MASHAAACADDAMDAAAGRLGADAAQPADLAGMGPMMKRKQKTKKVAPKPKAIRKLVPPSLARLANVVADLSISVATRGDKVDAKLATLITVHRGLCERLDDRDAAFNSSVRSIQDAIAKHTLSLQADFEEVSKFLFAGWGIRILPETLRILRHQDIADKVMQAMRAKTWIEPLTVPANGKGA